LLARKITFEQIHSNDALREHKDIDSPPIDCVVSYIFYMQIPMCPHSRPAWHFCNNCFVDINIKTIQIEKPNLYIEDYKKNEDPKSTIIIMDL
jgi:hypothetical protein